MKTSELLKKAKATIIDPSHWCQRFFAMRRAVQGVDVMNGRDMVECPSYSPEACNWCAKGAVFKEDGTITSWQAIWLLDEAAMALYGDMDIIEVNDRMGHAMTSACHDWAIARAEALEAEALK